MPVTKRHMVIESGSTSSAAGTCSVPTEIQLNRLTVTSREECESNKKNSATASTKLPATTPVPMTPTCFSLRYFPSRSIETNPHRGSKKMSVAIGAISALHLRELVDRGGRATAEDRDHDAESDRDLGGGDDHHEEDDGLTADVIQRAREGDESEVHGVQHQLDAHEHDERRTARQETEGADAEERGGEDEVPRGGDVHARSSLATGRSRRASNTAPTTAMMSSAAVASKAKRYVVKTAVPSWRTLPLPVESFVVTDAAPVTQCERAIRAMRPPMVMTTPTAAKARWPTS